MRTMLPVVLALTVAGLGCSAGSAMAASLSQKECSTKYQAAKTANQLNGLSWNEFRSKQCSSEAKAEPPAATPASVPAAPTTAKKVTPAAIPATPVVAGAMFPTAIAPEFANEKPRNARLHTCAKQWKVVKATPAAANMKWSVKGGGYYSECSKRLKG